MTRPMSLMPWAPTSARRSARPATSTAPLRRVVEDLPDIELDFAFCALEDPAALFGPRAAPLEKPEPIPDTLVPLPATRPLVVKGTFDFPEGGGREVAGLGHFVGGRQMRAEWRERVERLSHEPLAAGLLQLPVAGRHVVAASVPGHMFVGDRRDSDYRL